MTAQGSTQTQFHGHGSIKEFQKHNTMLGGPGVLTLMGGFSEGCEPFDGGVTSQNFASFLKLDKSN